MNRSGHWATSGVEYIRARFSVLLVLAFALAIGSRAVSADELEQGWDNPPTHARLRAYWWWLNGNVTPESITRDLEQMKAKGFGGAVIIDAGGATQENNAPVPHGPTFASPAWRELYKHALHEADRLGLQMSLNIQSGWNLGGPPVKPEDAAKKIVWSEAVVTGPGPISQRLPEPKHAKPFYRDSFVLAYPLKNRPHEHKPLSHWAEKAVYKTLHFSAPDTSELLEMSPDVAGEEDARASAVVDLSGKLGSDGTLHWDAPAGRWQVLRFGYTIADHASVSTSSEGWSGYALDPLDAGAFERYWDAVVEPLIRDAGPLAGTALKYLHTDSWEIEAFNWTPTLRQEFRARRGYDLLNFAPVLAGRIVDSRHESNRFLNDFRKTLGDLAIDHHYRLFRDNAHRHHLEIHPESGGPHAVPIDAQRCLGWDDAPMSEFWAWSWEHRIGDPNRFFIKQPASAAHTYGHPLVLGEGFTTIGPHWQERISDNLKPSFDKAICEGLNLLVWHAFVCSPKEMGIPGQQYFAGTHFNPQTTWWGKSQAFLSYINRCQWMAQQGLFVADACYYYGDQVPNFAQLRASDPARLGFGYDYDVITEEALLTRAAVRGGRIVLPDGMNYRVLVLPDRKVISLAVLRKVKELVDAGATVIGPRPETGESLENYPACDRELKTLADALWGVAGPSPATSRPAGAGRVISGRTAREVLSADGIEPDFELTGGGPATSVNYLHRRAGDADIYFVANFSNQLESLKCTFRVSGKAPEMWDAVHGTHSFARAYAQTGGRTTLPLDFAPCGSVFVVFRSPASAHPPDATVNTPDTVERRELAGPWQVSFDPRWGGPADVRFDKLVSWTDRPETGIRYYSGTATYRLTFDAPASAGNRRTWLDLGDVRELAEVKLNGKSLGVVWAPPFRVELTGATKPAGNQLEIEVVNFWPNRIIGDAFLPAGKGFTRTNIRRLGRKTALMESGLLGPVRILEEKNP